MHRLQVHRSALHSCWWAPCAHYALSVSELASTIQNRAKIALSRDFGLFIYRALAPAGCNTWALLGPLPAAAQLLRSTNLPSLISIQLGSVVRKLSSSVNREHPPTIAPHMGGATGGAWGTMPPPTFGTSGPMKMIFASTADSLYSVLYKWLNFNSPDSNRHLPS